VEDIFRTLEWLGLDWDEGPQSPDEQQLVHSQQLRLGRYRQLLNQLAASGHLFACKCSRKEIAAQAGEGMYSAQCLHRGLELTAPDVSWRLKLDEPVNIQVPDLACGSYTVNLNQELPYPGLRRRDGLPAYQLAWLADDLDHHINFVVRGADLLPSSALHLYLCSLLPDEPQASLFQQARFYHHPLFRDELGNKLSKSAGSLALREQRGSRGSAEAFYLMLSKLLGMKEEVTSAVELLQAEVVLPGLG
jgi:glutamyl/glutaminyl-tRNA synthetase